MTPDRVPPDDRVSPGYPAQPMSSWPPRPPGSVRRSSSLLSTWPEGPRGPLAVRCGARDVATSGSGEDHVLAEATVDVVFSADRVIERVAVDPPRGDPDRLVGSGPGRGFRRAIAAAFPDAEARRSLAYFLVEDLTTAPLLSTFALSRRADTDDVFVELSSGPVSQMENVCAGYRSGGLALELRRRNQQRSQNVAVVGRGVDGDPEAAWHPLEVPDGPAMCRRRRIDVVPDGDGFQVRAGFRDHAWEPDGSEAIVHEYDLEALVDAGPEGLVLVSLRAEPLVIPYPDCPSAANNVDRLVGTPLSGLRTRVLDELRGVDSCTHLSDMVRALAELPDLITAWPAVRS